MLKYFLYYLKYWCEPWFKKHSSISRNLVDISAVAVVCNYSSTNEKIMSNEH